MDVVSLCPLRVASVLWQPQRGGFALTIVAKATFHLSPVEARLAEEQEYPNDDDNHWNDDAARSLYSPTDLVPFKARPDVMLVGHAFAPRKEPVRALVARVAIADVDKSVEVTGDRAFTHDGQLREPVRFVKMPLRYERAAGGPDSANPVGVRPDGRPDAYGAVPLPNLLAPGTSITSRADVFLPTGFGPIAPAWPSRRQKLGRHTTRFHVGAWNDGPLPEDIDPSYFNAAPEDQRPSELRDDERIVLENLHPDHPRLVTNLPGLRPAVFVEAPGRAPQRIHLECDTLWIDTDRAICTLTWRGQLAMDSPAQAGRVTVAMEEGQKRLSWSDIQRIQSGGPAASIADEGTALTDLPTSDGPPSARDSARFALLGMAPASSAQRDGVVPFTPPVVSHMPEPSRARTTPVAPRRPMTLTDVSLSADLPFLRAERDAMEAARIAAQQSALPFASSGQPTSSAEHSSPSFALPFASSGQPPPPSGELSSPSFALPFASSGQQPPPSSPPAELSPSGFALPFASTPSTQIPPPMPSAELSSTAFSRTASGPEPSSAAFSRPMPPLAPPPPPLPAPPVLSTVSDSPWAGGGPRSDAPTFGSPYDPIAARAASPLITPMTPASPPPPPPPAPPFSPPVLAAATVGGALAASNAAASAIAPPAAIATPLPRSARNSGAREMIDLLWFDPTILTKVREHPRYKEILREIAPKPKKVSFDDDPFEDAAADEEDGDIKDRREIFGIVARGETSDAEGIGEAMAEAVSDDGTFIPPLVLLAGELSFVFDELAALKATVAATSPFATSDKKLKETLDMVGEILQTPWIQGSTGVADGLVQRIKEAFSQGNRTLPPSYLDTHTERMLLEQRAFQKRTVFGEPHLRTLLVPTGVQASIPTYLPEALSTKLPMVLRMRVRILAEAHLPQDQYETYAASLKAVAIGRVSPLPGRR